MTIEMDISHDPNIDLEERIKHNRRADDYAVEALALPTRDADTTQIRLEHAFVNGRRVELEEKGGTSTVEIRRLRTEAWEEIQKYSAELKVSSPDKGTEYENRVAKWGERLQQIKIGH